MHSQHDEDTISHATFALIYVYELLFVTVKIRKKSDYNTAL